MILKRDGVRRLQRATEVGTCVQSHIEELEKTKKRSVTPAVQFEQEDYIGDGEMTKGWYF